MNDQLITKAMLDDLGIDIGAQDVTTLIDHLNQTLDERIGEEITDTLDDAKLKELLELQDKGDEEAVGDWIGKNVPDLEKIVDEERDILLGELADGADVINDKAAKK